LDQYYYFKNNFNEEYEIYDFIFNYKFGNTFINFVNKDKDLKNKYIHLRTILNNIIFV